MKHVITATMIAGLLAGGAAIAQTTTAPRTTTPAPSVTTPSTTTTTPTTGMGMSTTGTTAPALGANSQAMPPHANTTAPAAVTTTTAPSRTTAAPVTGANSFTEAQARSRIQEKGFGNVTDLKKDDKGVWRGTAMKDGKSVGVALDYQGNIVGQ